MIKIYNTLTNQKEEFKPITAGEVKFYVCGPTVYDFFHIGNARSFIMSDVIRRYLEFAGYKVTYAMNLTDIDDKIINKANKEGSSAHTVAEKFGAAFFEDVNKLKIKPADIYPKATAHIPEILAMIEKLIERGFAYVSGNDVFYDISKFEEYGKLSGKNIDDLESGARVEINESKKSPLDFALWKGAKPGEPYWESSWGKGRPGWHIECSAMSCKHLGETFDIHAGGSDLIFPHHENEIAQSEGANGKKFVNYWLHFGFLNIDNEKMSKSLGNFFTTRDFLKQYSAETLRFFYLQTHYRSPLNFTQEALESSKKGLEKIQNLWERFTEITPGENSNEFDLKRFKDEFDECMSDDFNSPKALAVIFDFVKEFNSYLTVNQTPTNEVLSKAQEFLFTTAGGVFGLILTSDENTGSNLEPALIDLLVDIRFEAKLAKNFALADKIRVELNNLGIELKDSKEKTIWKKS